MNYRRLTVYILGFILGVIFATGYVYAYNTEIWEIEIIQGNYFRLDNVLYYKKELICKFLLKDSEKREDIEKINIYANEKLIQSSDNAGLKMGYELNTENILQEDIVDIKIEITDKQGKISSENYKFIRDNVMPEIKNLRVGDSEIAEEQGEICFYDDKVNVSFNFNDMPVHSANSGVKDVIFEKYGMEDEKFEEISIDIDGGAGEIYLDKGFRGYFIIRARDNLLNEYKFKSKYIIIADKNKSSSVILFNRENAGNNGYVNCDVNMGFRVENEFCGIRSIAYRVYTGNDGGTGNAGTSYGKTYILDKNRIDDELKIEKLNNNLINAITGKVPIQGNGNNIRVLFQVTDNAGIVKEEETCINIDKTLPDLKVIYDKERSEDGYYRNKLGIRLEIRDNNFDSGLINIFGLPNFSEPVLWIMEEDCYSAQLEYDREGEYELRISGTDMAGNKLPTYNDKFIIDLTSPAIEFTGVGDNSANSGAVELGISIKDKYLDDNLLSIDIIKDGKSINLPYTENKIKTGINYIFKDIPRAINTDGVYSVTAIAGDSAGNIIKKIINFSVNRFGSTYKLSPVAASIKDKYVRDVSDVKITEINVDKIDRQEINAYMVKNTDTIDLTLDKDFYVKESESDFKNSLDYTFPAGLFSEDGVYTLAIYSRDKAGNVNQSVKDENAGQITFGVDSKPPTVYFLNMEDNEEINNDKYIAEAAVRDNLKLDRVSVYDNGNLIPHTFENERLNFELAKSDNPRNILIEAYDLAGNKGKIEVKNILVNENIPNIISRISGRVPVKLPENLVENSKVSGGGIQRGIPQLIVILPMLILSLLAGVKIYQRISK